MIENEKQYEITKKWRENFQNNLQEAINAEVSDDWKRQVYINALRSQIETLSEEIKDYEIKISLNKQQNTMTNSELKKQHFDKVRLQITAILKENDMAGACMVFDVIDFETGEYATNRFVSVDTSNSYLKDEGKGFSLTGEDIQKDINPKKISYTGALLESFSSGSETFFNEFGSASEQYNEAFDIKPGELKKED